MKIVLAALAFLSLASPALAQPALRGPLAGLTFLVGAWKADDGKVADTGQRSAGTSVFTVEADGSALLRRDRTELTNPDGKPAGGFGQVMLIHGVGAGVGGEYVDGGGHVINYASAAITPGKSVAFTAPAGAAGPGFRLTYALTPKGDLGVEFGMLPPGGAPFQPIATGVLKKAP